MATIETFELGGRFSEKVQRSQPVEPMSVFLIPEPLNLRTHPTELEQYGVLPGCRNARRDRLDNPALSNLAGDGPLALVVVRTGDGLLEDKSVVADETLARPVIGLRTTLSTDFISLNQSSSFDTIARTSEAAPKASTKYLTDHIVDRESLINNPLVRFAISRSKSKHKNHIIRLYSEMLVFNDLYFGATLPPIIIRVTTPPRSTYIGYASPWVGGEAKYEIGITPSYVNGTNKAINPDHHIEGRYRYIDDLLLHELVHIFLAERGMYEDKYKAHGPAFAAECNRIGRMIGTEMDVTWKSRGIKNWDKRLCNYWPHLVRYSGYYIDLFE